MATIGGPVVLNFTRDQKAWVKMVRDLERAVVEYPNVTERAMKVVTKWLQRQVKTGITKGAPGGRPLKRNAPATIRKKGFDRPLIEKAFLRSNVVMNVSRKGRVVSGAVGIQKFRPHPSDPGRRTVARIAAFHEFGFRTGGGGAGISGLGGRFIRRRFLQPVLVREAPEIQKLFAKVWSQGAARRMRIRGPIKPKIVRGTFRV